MDRIGRIGHQHDVAGRGDRLRHVGEALFRAERGDDLRIRIELHAEAALVIIGLGAAQAGDALGGGVTVGARLAGGLDQLVDDMLGRRQIGIAHAEVDDVGAGVASLGLEPVDLLEDVGRQALHAIEIRHVSLSFLVSPAHRAARSFLERNGRVLKCGKSPQFADFARSVPFSAAFSLRSGDRGRGGRWPAHDRLRRREGGGLPAGAGAGGVELLHGPLRVRPASCAAVAWARFRSNGV